MKIEGISIRIAITYQCFVCLRHFVGCLYIPLNSSSILQGRSYYENGGWEQWSNLLKVTQKESDPQEGPEEEFYGKAEIKTVRRKWWEQAITSETRGKNQKVFVEANMYEERELVGYGGFMFHELGLLSKVEDGIAC